MANSPGYLLKLNRTATHLDALDIAAQRFVEKHCRASIEFEADAREYVLRAHISAQPSPDLSILAGDCAHNLRSALDHIVFQLAQCHHNGPLPESAAKSVEFPIYTTKTAYRDQAPRKIKLLHPKVQEIIKAMQPYHGGDCDLIGFAHELDRIDKHRKLNLTVTGSKEIIATAGFVQAGGFTISQPPGPVEDKADLLRWPIAPGNPDQQPTPQGHATFEVIVSEGPYERWWLVPQLRATGRLIREQVIPPLLPYL